jgi:hypothetical protein
MCGPRGSFVELPNEGNQLGLLVAIASPNSDVLSSDLSAAYIERNLDEK